MLGKKAVVTFDPLETSGEQLVETFNQNKDDFEASEVER